jgi:mannose/fructose/N-acetylgalactosamine-specific phosphotransferase system component IIC
MVEQFVPLILIAGLVSMDTTEGPQVLVSEPLVSCTAAGLVFGNVILGVVLGILFQMLFIGYLPFGASRYYDGTVGSLIGAASLLGARELFGFSEGMTMAGLVPALLWGFVVSVIGVHLSRFMRMVNSTRIERYLAQFERKAQQSVAVVHLAGVGRSFLRGSVMAAVLVPVGVLLLGCLKYLPVVALSALSGAAYFIGGLTAAVGILFWWDRNRYAAFSLGAIGGLLWVLVLAT